MSEQVATRGTIAPPDSDCYADSADASAGPLPPPSPSLKQSAMSGAMWSFAESWTNQVLQLIIFIVLARYLAPQEFGLVATATLFCQLFQNTFLAGVNAPLIRMTSNDRAADNTGFVMAAGLGVAIVVTLFACADWLQRLYGMPGLASLIRVLSVGSLLASLAVAQQAWMIRNLKFKPLAVRTMLATATGGALAVVMAMSGYGAMSLAAYYVASSLLGLIVLWSSSPWRPALAWSPGPAKEIARYGRHVSATGAINFVNENADVLVIGYVLGPAAAGIYVVGKRAFTAANALLAGALSRLAVPVFSQIHDDRQRLAAAFLRAVKTTSIVTTPAFVGMALVAPEFLMLFFGPQWLSATVVMQALCIVGVIQSLGLYNHALILALGKPNWQTALTLLYAAVNFATFAVVARFGIAAVAVAFAVRAYVLYPLSVALVMRLVPISVPRYLKALHAPLIAAGAMALGVVLLRGLIGDWSASARLVTLTIAGAALYTAVLALIGRRDLDELRSLWPSLSPPDEKAEAA